MSVGERVTTRQQSGVSERSDAYRLPGVLLALADAVLFAGAVAVAHRLRTLPSTVAWLNASGVSQYTDVPFLWDAVWPVALSVAILGVLALQRFGAYRLREGFARQLDTASSIAAVVVAYVFLAAILFGVKVSFARSSLIFAAALTITFLLLLRPIWDQLQAFCVRQGVGFRKALLVSPTESVPTVIERVRRHYGSYYQFLGIVPSGSTRQSGANTLPVVGTFDNVVGTAARTGADSVLFALPTVEHRRLVHVLKACATAGIDARVVPDLFDALTTTIAVGDELEAVPIVTLDATPLDGTGRWIKRTLDLAVAGVALLVAAPVIAILAALIRLDSPGPALYRQRRIGSDGRVFWMLKLRSMRHDAEQNGPGWTVPGDPRVTRLGQWLRRSNLDELPQLWNVLRGEMSLVGPRPERPEYVNQFKRSVPRYMRRHLVKSGITGLAQIAGLRGDTSISERTRYDLYYIENWSIWLDLRILVRTLFAWRNAY